MFQFNVGCGSILQNLPFFGTPNNWPWVHVDLSAFDDHGGKFPTRVAWKSLLRLGFNGSQGPHWHLVGGELTNDSIALLFKGATARVKAPKAVLAGAPKESASGCIPCAACEVLGA